MSKPSASISPYYTFTLFSFLPSQTTQALLFLKAIWLGITPDLKFFNGGKKKHSTELQDIPYVSQHLCSASKRIVITGKWRCHCPLSKQNGVFQAAFQGNSYLWKSGDTAWLQKSCWIFFPVISVHVTSYIEAGACILKWFLKPVENWRTE